MHYKMGQILILKEETEVELENFEEKRKVPDDTKKIDFVSKEKIKIPAGNKIIVGADKMAHHMSIGLTQPISGKIEISGYDPGGIAEYLISYLENEYPMEELFEHCGIERNDFRDAFEFALNKIGFR